MEMDDPQHKQLREALLKAFPTHKDLEMMVSNQLGENLSARVGRDGNLEQTVFELVRWAEAEGKLKELVIGARKQNDGNPQLRNVAELFASEKDENPACRIPTGEAIQKVPTDSRITPTNSAGSANVQPVPPTTRVQPSPKAPITKMIIWALLGIIILTTLIGTVSRIPLVLGPSVAPDATVPSSSVVPDATAPKTIIPDSTVTPTATPLRPVVPPSCFG